jgi:hypothetical protein
MKVWLGHYKGAPSEWFICWGQTKDEAINFVDCEVAEPDFDSVRPLEGAGMIQLAAVLPKPDDEEDDYDPDFPLARVTFVPGDERLGADHPRLGMDDVERITEVLMAPPSGDEGPRDVSPGAAQLGITDPRVMATYAPRCDECGKKHFGPCVLAR